MSYLFVDASYYIFFRYHALKNWWKLAKKDEPQDYSINNAAFVTQFKKLFATKFKEIFKKLKLDPKKTTVFVGKDCLRCDNWRNQHIDDYKEGRVENNEIGAFFKMIYRENLFQQIPDVSLTVLDYPSLEADDCIALGVKRLYNQDVKANNVCEHKYYIITSDHDYGQLLAEDASIVLYNLKYKNLCDNKKLFPNGKQNLVIKICSGDKSDNIPSVFPKCGFVTAKKMHDNPEFFQEKLAISGVREKIEHNNLIINFDCIPQELQCGFYAKYQSKL